jgi:hypothetical protein
MNTELFLAQHETSVLQGRINRLLLDSIDMLQVAQSALHKGRTPVVDERLSYLIESFQQFLQED